MRPLLTAMRTNDSLTENGCVTNSTSLNFCVDLFFEIGAMRGKEKSRLLDSFAKAFGEDALTAMKLLFWARDIRGGAGERQIFRDIVAHLAATRPNVLAKNLHLIPEFGRWDDLLVLIGTDLEKDALNLIKKAIKDKESAQLRFNSSLDAETINDLLSKIMVGGTCAKWMPRPNVNDKVKKHYASVLRKFLGLTPKEYRKLLAENSNTVETMMCLNRWSEIDYSKLPSKAISGYMKAFNKRDKERFSAFIASVEKGETKINAGAVYPYDIIKNVRNGSASGADVQWNALPNYLEGSNERFIPIVDTSGSMFWESAKVSEGLYAGHIGQSLGLYIAERNVGPFKDAFITFNSSPELVVVSGSLSERLYQVDRLRVGGSTNLLGVYKLILHKAVEFNVPQSEMPTMVIIFSDMEFDGGGYGESAQASVERLFTEAGYAVPKVIYWNLAARNDKNKPVHFDKSNTALVSGFSPSLLGSLLGGKDITPYSMMMNVIDSPRYSVVTI